MTLSGISTSISSVETDSPRSSVHPHLVPVDRDVPGDDLQDLLLQRRRQVVAADERALVLQQDLQPVPRDRGRAALGEQPEEAHATRLPNSRPNRPLFSPWIVIGTASPRSRLAASE